MDGTLTTKAGSGGKAMPAGIDAGGGAATPSARVARKATLPGGTEALADAPAAATAAPGEESKDGGGRGGEEDDDEQVERFYALLDNIRAMRGAYVSGDDGTGALDDGVVDTGGAAAGARVKRLRGSEPPWRPAFRLEDFEEPTPTSSSSSDVAAPCAKRTRGQEEADGGEGRGGARPAVAYGSTTAAGRACDV